MCPPPPSASKPPKTLTLTKSTTASMLSSLLSFFRTLISPSGAASREIDELCRSSCISDGSFEVDLECGSPGCSGNTVSPDKNEKDCRICQLGLESNVPESCITMVLGCSCKDDLAAAHKQCAQTWFKIRENTTCEICGSIAKNVTSVGETEAAKHSVETGTNITAPTPPTETRRFWQGHRFLNFLLACMIFAFVISWLFHFNVRSCIVRELVEKCVDEEPHFNYALLFGISFARGLQW